MQDFQKDAIYRQMLEYKREKSTLEARLSELEQSSTDHDDHLRILDAWWLQLVQEVSQLAGDQIPFQPDLEGTNHPVPSVSMMSPVLIRDQRLHFSAPSISKTSERSRIICLKRAAL